MNSRRTSLLLVAVNLALLATVAYMVRALKFNPTVIAGPAGDTIVTNTVTQIAVRKINATNLLAALTNRPLNWRALESTNYVVYIENLRNFGCPEETIRDIIITDVAKLYGRRRAELRAQLQPYRFWQTADPLTGVPSTSPDLQRAFRELDKEQRELIRDLLGVDLRTEMAKYWHDEQYPEPDYSYLPADKQEEVRALTAKFEDLEQDIYARSGGLLLDADQEQLKELERQRKMELAAVLTPQELEEHELRHSSTAENMRTQLTGFQPTEEEFRKMFRLQRTFDESFDQAFDTRDDAAMTVRAQAEDAAQNALNEEIRKTIGPERFAEYQRAQDTDYRAVLQLTERFQAPPDLAAKVYNMKQAAEQYKLQVESNPNFTEEQRAQIVAALARETERSVATTMGEQVFRAYQNTGGDGWLNTLPIVDQNAVPLPPPPTGTTLPYDINLLPPALRAYLLNPFPQFLPQPPQQ
jgi:hypothetical protein